MLAFPYDVYQEIQGIFLIEHHLRAREENFQFVLFLSMLNYVSCKYSIVAGVSNVMNACLTRINVMGKFYFFN